MSWNMVGVVMLKRRFIPFEKLIWAATNSDESCSHADGQLSNFRKCSRGPSHPWDVSVDPNDAIIAE